MITQTSPNRPSRLSDARPGDQLVRVSGRRHARQVATVKKVWKNGVIEIENDGSTYSPSGYRRGERSTWSSSPYLRPFNADETPETIAADTDAAHEAAEAESQRRAEESANRKAEALTRNAENISRMITVPTPTWGEVLNILDYIDREGQRKTAVFYVREDKDLDWKTGGYKTVLSARVAGAGYERRYGNDDQIEQRYEGFSSWSTITGDNMADVVAQIVDR